MALSFVVEEGLADPDANSYVDTDFADDYIDANTYASADWLAQSETVKQKLLVRSSKILDARIQWEGERLDQDSGLRWPRHGVYDRDGFLIPENVIPVALKEAVCEFAVYLMNSDWTVPIQQRGLKEVQVGPIDIKFDATYQQISIPDTVTMILQGLGLVNSGRRPGFKKIVRT